jgi:hypothetical protein
MLCSEYFAPGAFGMARTAATLGEEARLTDYISLGVITRSFPEKAIRTHWLKPAEAASGSRSYRPRW